MVVMVAIIEKYAAIVWQQEGITVKRYQEKMEKVSAEKTAELLSQNPQALFAAEETAFDSKMREVCNYVIEKQTAIILLAGPSASGKTTTS